VGVAELRAHLHRFWIRFEDAPPSLGLGMGVTALDRADAESLLATSTFLAGRQLPTIREVVQDVDVRDLDPGHVLPNMGDPTIRGVWFPRP
jgi:hypothetical protein